ncbi:hypothetical protein [Maridesulfovibrio sp. FT414]|uniref:hypothetical protein n=1 Tax=Maridesulfovibrio sp. FT414 TaxID=2979469 RepID=UPI003D80264B
MSISAIGYAQKPQEFAESISDYSSAPELQEENSFVESLMISKDKDSNGILDLKESGLRQKEFAKYDHDGNGQISMSEVSAYLEQKAKIGELSVAMGQVEDYSGSGAKEADSSLVSFESSGLDADSFSKFDSDGDGLLSADELGAAIQAEKIDEEADASTAFSEALSEFKKNAFRKEEEKKEDLDGNGEVSAAERRADREGKIKDKETVQNVEKGITDSATDDAEMDNAQMGADGRQAYSSSYMAGIRAYRKQSGDSVAFGNQFSTEY